MTTRSSIQLGHTIPAHQAFGWCSHCPDRTVAEELAAWQTREPADEAERLRTENERLRHQLEVMYGGAFDSLHDVPAPGITPVTHRCYAAELSIGHEPHNIGRQELAIHCPGYVPAATEEAR